MRLSKPAPHYKKEAMFAPFFQSALSSRRRSTSELKFPRDGDGRCRAIGEVVIGPTKDPRLTGEALAVLCRKHRIDCRPIAYSTIPFRQR